MTAQGVERIRTTAESHRRIAIIEVMGRHSGYIALGTAYGQPDIILVPEHPLDIELLVERVRHLYDLQKNVVIVCGEGIVDEQGVELGAESTSTDPAGNVALSGAAEALRAKMIELLGDRYFQRYRRGSSAREAIFTRKVGHTQRGGRPILFDRFYAALLGSKAVDLLVEGRNNAVSVLQYNSDKGFHVEGYDANRFRDRWGLIHARQMHPALYDPLLMKPSRMGIDYLLPIFTDAIGNDDAEHMRQTLFDPGNLSQPYHSINTDVHKRIRYLNAEAAVSYSWQGMSYGVAGSRPAANFDVLSASFGAGLMPNDIGVAINSPNRDESDTAGAGELQSTATVETVLPYETIAEVDDEITSSSLTAGEAPLTPPATSTSESMEEEVDLSYLALFDDLVPTTVKKPLVGEAALQIWTEPLVDPVPDEAAVPVQERGEQVPVPDAASGQDRAAVPRTEPLQEAGPIVDLPKVAPSTWGHPIARPAAAEDWSYQKPDIGFLAEPPGARGTRADRGHPGGNGRPAREGHPRLRRQRRSDPCPSGPGGHSVRVRACSRHQVISRDRVV